jgi:hypothetical protein
MYIYIHTLTRIFEKLLGTRQCADSADRYGTIKLDCFMPADQHVPKNEDSKICFRDSKQLNITGFMATNNQFLFCTVRLLYILASSINQLYWKPGNGWGINFHIMSTPLDCSVVIQQQADRNLRTIAIISATWQLCLNCFCLSRVVRMSENLYMLMIAGIGKEKSFVFHVLDLMSCWVCE